MKSISIVWSTVVSSDEFYVFPILYPTAITWKKLLINSKKVNTIKMLDTNKLCTCWCVIVSSDDCSLIVDDDVYPIYTVPYHRYHVYHVLMISYQLPSICVNMLFFLSSKMHVFIHFYDNCNNVWPSYWQELWIWAKSAAVFELKVANRIIGKIIRFILDLLL